MYSTAPPPVTIPREKSLKGLIAHLEYNIRTGWQPLCHDNYRNAIAKATQKLQELKTK